jgi:hypothetical protein
LKDYERYGGVEVKTNLLACSIESVAVTEGNYAQRVLDPKVVRMKMTIGYDRFKVGWIKVIVVSSGF